MKDLITVCVMTHSTKTDSRGPWAGYVNNVPTAPSTKMLEKTLHNLLESTSLPMDIPIVVGVDNRVGRSVDEEYVDNLEKLRSVYPNLVVLRTNATSMDPLVTAPVNFVNTIGAVTTPYYLLWEHDHLFVQPIDLKSILDSMIKHGTNLVRFGEVPNKVDLVRSPETILIPEKKDKTDIPLLKVDHFSNRPYICKTEIFNKWWKHLVYETAEEGGFVEGPMNVFYKFAISKMGFMEAQKKWGIYMYGHMNDGPYVSHIDGNSFNN